MKQKSPSNFLLTSSKNDVRSLMKEQGRMSHESTDTKIETKMRTFSATM